MSQKNKKFHIFQRLLESDYTGEEWFFMSVICFLYLSVFYEDFECKFWTKILMKAYLGVYFVPVLP